MTAQNSRTLLGTNAPLAKRYDVALLDLDGVVYLGPDAIPGAAKALAAATADGMRLEFVTNNASRTPEDVAKHLTELGIPAAADEVVTSSQAAARVLFDRCGADATVLVIGTDALRATVEELKLRVVRSADDKPDAVVQGYSPTIAYADLAEAALAVRAGALWVATNADATLPSPRGQLPGNGSLVAAVATATGKKPVVAGKPELPLHAEAVRRSAAKNPLVVGDRLDTDIEGAHAADTDSLLVLTGVTRAHDLIDAPPHHRPTYLALDLSGLLDTRPDAAVSAGVIRCGGWSVTVTTVDGKTQTKLDGDGPAIDGLRAVLLSCWSFAAGSEGGHLSSAPAVDATDALRRLGLD